MDTVVCVTRVENLVTPFTFQGLSRLLDHGASFIITGR